MSANRRLFSLANWSATRAAAVSFAILPMTAPQNASGCADFYPPGQFVVVLGADAVVVETDVDAAVEGARRGVPMELTVDATDIRSDLMCADPAPPATSPTSPTSQPLGGGAGSTCTAWTSFGAPSRVGNYTVRVAETAGRECKATTQLAVVAGDGGSIPTTTTAPTGGRLPKTGSDVWRILTVASAIIALGGMGFVAGHRRREATRPG